MTKNTHKFDLPTFLAQLGLKATDIPVRTNKHGGADLISRFLFPISYRTLERWPITWQRVNGYAVCETAELLAHAQSLLDAAPKVRGGKRPAIQEKAA